MPEPQKPCWTEHIGAPRWQWVLMGFIDGLAIVAFVMSVVYR